MYYIQLLINGLSVGAVYALIALGFTLIFSILKFSNFSHGGVMVLSAYAGYIIIQRFQTGFFMTMLLTAVVGGFISLVVQFIGFERLRKTNGSVMLYFVSSSTMGILLQNLIAISKFGGNYYSYPAFFQPPFLEVGGFTFTITDLVMLGFSTIVIVVMFFVLYKTRLGTSIRALSMDSNTAKLMGINVSLVVGLTFFISGMLGAVAGVFCGINYVLYPQLANLVTKGMVASVIGGLGNISGALYGGLILGISEVFLINFFGAGYAPVFVFLLSVFFLIVRPQGLAGKIVHEKV